MCRIISAIIFILCSFSSMHAMQEKFKNFLMDMHKKASTKTPYVLDCIGASILLNFDVGLYKMNETKIKEILISANNLSAKAQELKDEYLDKNWSSINLLTFRKMNSTTIYDMNSDAIVSYFADLEKIDNSCIVSLKKLNTHCEVKKDNNVLTIKEFQQLMQEGLSDK